MKRIICSVILMFLAACGRSSPPPIATPTMPISMGTPAPIPIDTPMPPTPTPTQQLLPIPVTEEALSHALLTIDDMPTGWIISKPDEEPDDDSGTYQFLCLTLEKRTTAKVEANFQGSVVGPFLWHQIAAYPLGGAEAFMEDARQAIESCSEWTHTDDNGKEEVAQVSPMSFPKLGDDSIAIGMIIKGESQFTWQINSVYIRIGHFLASVHFMSMGGSEPGQLEAFARLAEERLRDLSQSLL